LLAEADTFVRIFEFTNKTEATKALEGFKKNAILSFTK